MNPLALNILGHVRQVLDGEAALAPDGRYGAEYTERCVEAPWAAGWLAGRERILDIGFTFASADYLGLLVELLMRGAKIEGVDIIAPSRVRSRYPQAWRAVIERVPVHLGDIRAIDLPQGAFDAVACISTIEHVGFDAVGSGPESAFARWRQEADTPLDRDPETVALVLRRIRAALAPGGVLLISTPVGRGGAIAIQDSLGFWTRHWESSPQDWRDLVSQPGFSLIEERFFRHDPELGWRTAETVDHVADAHCRGMRHAAAVGLAALKAV